MAKKNMKNTDLQAKDTSAMDKTKSDSVKENGSSDQPAAQAKAVDEHLELLKPMAHEYKKVNVKLSELFRIFYTFYFFTAF